MLLPGCNCCGGDIRGICWNQCSSTFSRRTNNITTTNGPHSGGYLFAADIPNGLSDGDVVQYEGTLEVEIEGTTITDWLLYTHWDKYLGYSHYSLLPAAYPLNVNGNTKSPVWISVYLNGVRKTGDYNNFGQCAATATFRFLDSMYYNTDDDWWNAWTSQASVSFNGYGGYFLKANPMAIGECNPYFLSADQYSIAGATATDDTHYFIPDVISEATIATNWGTVGVQPYTMVPLAEWRAADTFYFKATRHREAIRNFPDEYHGPRPGSVGQVYEATIKWPAMLSVGPACQPFPASCFSHAVNVGNLFSGPADAYKQAFRVVDPFGFDTDATDWDSNESTSSGNRLGWWRCVPYPPTIIASASTYFENFPYTGQNTLNNGWFVRHGTGCYLTPNIEPVTTSDLIFNFCINGTDPATGLPGVGVRFYCRATGTTTYLPDRIEKDGVVVPATLSGVRLTLDTGVVYQPVEWMEPGAFRFYYQGIADPVEITIYPPIVSAVNPLP